MPCRRPRQTPSRASIKAEVDQTLSRKVAVVKGAHQSISPMCGCRHARLWLPTFHRMTNLSTVLLRLTHRLAYFAAMLMADDAGRQAPPGSKTKAASYWQH